MTYSLNPDDDEWDTDDVDMDEPPEGMHSIISQLVKCNTTNQQPLTTHDN